MSCMPLVWPVSVPIVATCLSVKLELVCDDGRADEAVPIIWKNGRTGQRMVGWVYVVEINTAYRIHLDSIQQSQHNR